MLVARLGLSTRRSPKKYTHNAQKQQSDRLTHTSQSRESARAIASERSAKWLERNSAFQTNAQAMTKFFGCAASSNTFRSVTSVVKSSRSPLPSRSICTSVFAPFCTSRMNWLY